MNSTLPLGVAAALLCSAPVFAADAKKPAPAPAKAPAPAPAPASEPAAPAAPPEAKPYVLPDSVATVEGVEIKKEELEKAFASALAGQGIPPDAVPAAQKEQAYKMVLDELIVDKLVTKRAADITVSDADVNTTFDKLKKNFGSDEEMKAQLAQTGQTEEKIRADIRTSLREQKWLETQVKDSAAVTDKDADEFYQKNPDKFQKPEQVRASHILVKVKPDATPAEVTEKQKQAEAIAKRVKGGEDFAKVASELSEDPSAKQNAGDLSFFSKEQMVPEFSEAAFALKKDTISEPVRSEFGYHIIKVTDRKAGEKMTLEQVKPQLLAFLQRQKKEQQIGKVLHDLRDSSDVKVNLPTP